MPIQIYPTKKAALKIVLLFKIIDELKTFITHNS